MKKPKKIEPVALKTPSCVIYVRDDKGHFYPLPTDETDKTVADILYGSHMSFTSASTKRQVAENFGVSKSFIDRVAPPGSVLVPIIKVEGFEVYGQNGRPSRPDIFPEGYEITEGPGKLTYKKKP